MAARARAEAERLRAILAEARLAMVEGKGGHPRRPWSSRCPRDPWRRGDPDGLASRRDRGAEPDRGAPGRGGARSRVGGPPSRPGDRPARRLHREAVARGRRRGAPAERGQRDAFGDGRDHRSAPLTATDDVSEPAVGITGIGVHVPRYRLSAETLGAVWGVGGSGTRAVANHDEDSLTMAVEAGLAALGDGDGAGLDLVCLASTTAPYAEKSSAAVLSAVLDCGPSVSVADLGGSLRAGTTGLRLALDAVRAGSAREALVAAADIRLAPPGSDLEPAWGDGAAAVRIGAGRGLVARLVGAASHTHEFSDVWRLADTRFPELGDPTFVRAYGYERLMAEAAGRLLRPDGRRARGDPAGGRVRAGRPARSGDPPEPRAR